ncbi:hypothetical protein [Leptolyngbya ohadii]|uniref:hypothetical protein n=1 Tax=Leptolyngbya ohadii TaxID=1962290 RepID=UPI000B59D56E|nr:hypothetical protein [Leptolyngbya ohadii]
MNDKLLPLLKQWAALEPERCKPYEGQITHLRTIERWLPINNLEPSWDETAKIQRLVQEAIISRKLRSRMESTPEGHHHATLLDLHGGCHAIGDDTEPAIALLQAYVSYLEQVAAKKQGAVA